MPVAAAAPIIASGIGAVGSLAGSLIGPHAATTAASDQEAAANQAQQNALVQYEQTAQNLAPYNEAGQSLIGQQSSLFGPSYSNPLVAGSMPSLTAESPSVQALSQGVAPSIQAAITSKQPNGSLPGGYSYNVSNGQFQLISPTGGVVGQFNDDPSSAGAIATQLSIGFGNSAQAQQAQASGQAPTILGLNDSTYGIPALGNTNFLTSMGVNNVSQLAFNPAGGTNFYAAMGVNGPQDLSFNPTQATLDNLPGYRFELQQGLQATQNAAAAQGLGVSGAALKGAAGYAQGLASSDLNTYYNEYEGNLNNLYNQFEGNLSGQYNAWSGNLNNLSNVFSTNLLNQYNINQGAVNNAYNRMAGITSLGENAAATTGSQGVQAVGNANQALVGGANAAAAGTVGSANALTSGLTGVGSSATNALLLNSLLGNSNSNSSAPISYNASATASPALIGALESGNSSQAGFY